MRAPYTNNVARVITPRITEVPRSGSTTTSPMTRPLITSGGNTPMEKAFTFSALRDSSRDR